MPDPFSHNNNLIGQSSHGPNIYPSLSLDSSNSQRVTPINNHSDVDINLALNSATNFPSQNQAIPISGQNRFRQNGTESGFIRSSSNFPSDMHVNSMSHSPPVRPQNSLNINIFMGNLSSMGSININLLSNNVSPQFTRNNRSAPSSNNTPERNNLINCPSSSYQQICLSPNQEPLANNIMELNESPHFTTSYTQHTSSRVTALSGNPLYTSVPSTNQEIPVAIPYLSQNAVNSSIRRRQASLPGQSIHCQDHIIPQSNSNLNFLRQSSRYFPRENRNGFPSFQNSTMILAEEQSLDIEERNNKSSEDELHPQQSVQTPGTFPEHSDIPALPQVPYQNDTMTGSPKPNFQLRRQAQGSRHSPIRCKSHPYIKYGPYTCPKCHVTYDSSNRYAAHVQKHYKDETPDERKKRREGKFKSRDLYIAQSTDGITIMPGSIPMEEMVLVQSNTIGETDTSHNPGEGSSGVKIKEEFETDSM